MTRFLWAAAYVLGWAMLAGVVLGVFLHFYPSRGDVALYLTSAVQFALIPGVIAIVVFAVLRRWFMLAIAIVAVGGLASTQLPLRAPPLLREHRLYQADWMLRFYGFSVDEIGSAMPNGSVSACRWPRER